MQVVDRVKATKRANEAMQWLEKHPATTRSQLGAARDLVNGTHRLRDHDDVWDCIGALEGMVCGLYGGRPD